MACLGQLSAGEGTGTVTYRVSYSAADGYYADYCDFTVTVEEAVPENFPTGISVPATEYTIDVDEVLAGMPPAPDAVARLVEAARAFASWDHCLPGNINLEAACRDIRAALAAIEADHD